MKVIGCHFSTLEARPIELHAFSPLITISLVPGVDTDEIYSHEDNMEEEVIEFLLEVEETVVEE